MTLRDTVHIFEVAAKAQPAVLTVVPEDIFTLNALKDVRYGVFGWEQRRHTVTSGNMATYRFTWYYVDRLTDGGDNEVDIIAAGHRVLANMLRVLAAQGIFVDMWEVTPFLQRFADQCAGVSAEVAFTVPMEIDCDIIRRNVASFDKSFDYSFEVEVWTDERGRTIFVI